LIDKVDRDGRLDAATGSQQSLAWGMNGNAQKIMTPAAAAAAAAVCAAPQSVFEQYIKLWDKKVGQVKDFFDF
jgi:hypothetical protein